MLMSGQSFESSSELNKNEVLFLDLFVQTLSRPEFAFCSIRPFSGWFHVTGPNNHSCSYDLEGSGSGLSRV